jgi:hypothetical protein
MVKLIFCHCKHEYQDKKYGRGLRVHNRAVKKGTWRCTVCKTERG